MVTPLAPTLPAAGCPENAGSSWDDFLGELTIDRVTISSLELSSAPVEVGGDGQESLFYVSRETAVFELGQVEHKLEQGSLFHLAPGQSAVVRSGLRPGTLLELRFSAHLLGEIGLSEFVDLPAAINPGINSITGQYFLAALGLSQAAPIGRQQCLRSLTTLAVISLVRDHVPEAAALLGRAQVIQIRRLLPAIRLLRANVGAVHTVQSLAQSCHLSVAQFRRLFCAKFKMSPSRYIQRLRVREACRLLCHSDQTVGEICVRIGYEQPSHFHKTFKRLIGITPRSYRDESLTRRAG